MQDNFIYIACCTVYKLFPRVYCIQHSLQWLSVKIYFNVFKVKLCILYVPTYIISVTPKEFTKYTEYENKYHYSHRWLSKTSMNLQHTIADHFEHI